jgi:pimeloyl-ACP methyl ester carboxylesterase
VSDGSAAGVLHLGDHAVWCARRAGRGAPVLLLHGGLSHSGVLAPMVDHLDADLDVWRYDRASHGRSPDAPGPITYDRMVSEAEAVIEGAIGRAVHVVGHSDGANLALLLAIRRPELVLSVSAFSANTDPTGVDLAAFDIDEVVEDVRADYAALAPNGDADLAGIASRIAVLWRTEPVMRPADLGAIGCDVLVASADRDAIPLEHTIALHRALPSSQLAVVPGTTHMLVAEEPALCSALVQRRIASASG